MGSPASGPPRGRYSIPEVSVPIGCVGVALVWHASVTGARSCWILFVGHQIMLDSIRGEQNLENWPDPPPPYRKKQ